MKLWKSPLSRLPIKVKRGPLGRRGITLVELMMSMSIFGIILGVVFAFMVQTSRSYGDSRERAHYQQSCRATLNLMTREIRSAGCDPQDVGFEKIALADVAQIRCKMDLNGDKDTNDLTPTEDVTYAYNAALGEIWRIFGGGSQVILRGLNAVTFTYYDSDGVILAGTPLSVTDRAEVAFVEIDLDGETESGEPVRYQSRVHIRNF